MEYTIYIGSDHRGFALKSELQAHLASQGYVVEDMGDTKPDTDDDYPDFAAAVARAVTAHAGRGILICGSGTGICIAANKICGARCAAACSVEQVKAGRTDDDINILALAADFTGADDAKKFVDVFLATSFAGEERFVRRLRKVAELENS